MKKIGKVVIVCGIVLLAIGLYMLYNSTIENGFKFLPWIMSIFGFIAIIEGIGGILIQATIDRRLMEMKHGKIIDKIHKDDGDYLTVEFDDGTKSEFIVIKE